MKQQISLRQVRNYLNHLHELKSEIKPPLSIIEDEGIFTILDGDGIPKISCSKKILDLIEQS